MDLRFRLGFNLSCVFLELFWPVRRNIACFLVIPLFQEPIVELEEHWQ